MNRTFILCMFLSCLMVAPASAQKRTTDTRLKPQRVRPCDHVYMVSFGFGAIGETLSFAPGLEYEQFLERRNHLSATLKLAGFIGSSGRYSHADGYELNSRNSGLFIAPGIRYHPLGNKHKVDLGLGVALPAGYVRRSDILGRYSVDNQEGVYDSYFGAATAELTANFHARYHRATFSLFTQVGYIYANCRARSYAFYTPQGIVSYANTSSPTSILVGLRFGARW